MNIHIPKLNAIRYMMLNTFVLIVSETNLSPVQGGHSNLLNIYSERGFY